jgi:hypothetical protein
MDQQVRYRINAPHIVHEIFEDKEAAIINLKSGNYYSLDPVGAVVWAQIGAGATFGEIIDEMLARYDGDSALVRRSVEKFIDALATEELVAVVSDGKVETNGARVNAAEHENGGKIPFTPPMLERYNDMQELLLLDPIHEVDDAGWPNRKRED